MSVRGVLAALLVLEAIAVGLFVPVAVAVADVDASVAAPIGVAVALACIVVAGLLRRPWGIAAGTGLQVVTVLLGLVVPAMFVVGGIFALLWVLGLRLGRQVEQIQAERAAAADSADGDEPHAG